MKYKKLIINIYLISISVMILLILPIFSGILGLLILIQIHPPWTSYEFLINSYCFAGLGGFLANILIVKLYKVLKKK